MNEPERVDVVEAAGTSGTQRVVLQCVKALVLDDLSFAERQEVRDAVGAVRDALSGAVVECEAWVPVATRPGTVEAAVKAYSGPSGTPDARAGTYKAVPYASWFVPPLVIEPPL
jgi:hypothetical protein